MKKLSCLIILLLSTLNYAQTEIALGENDKLVYLDSTYREVTKENHKYYRIIKDYYLDNPKYRFLEYYKSNQLKKESIHSGKDGGSPNGDEINYYENGNRQSVKTYIDGRPQGKSSTWYENGNLKEEGEYYNASDVPSKYYKLNQYWDYNKNQLVINGNGKYTNGDNEGFLETGTYKEGFKDGSWEGKNFKANDSYSEKYENGNFISGKRFLADGTTIDYSEIFIQPVPKKGLQDFYKFIGKNYRTPDMPRGYKGKVIVNFVVDKNGEINETSIIKDIGYGTGEEAIRVLMKYGDWQPGMQRGKNVRCYFSLPITIQSSN